jgi:hypothetical protein
MAIPLVVWQTEMGKIGQVEINLGSETSWF